MEKSIYKAMYDVKEAARILFGSESESAYKRTLRLVKSNQIKAIKDGSRYYISRNTLEEYFGSDSFLKDNVVPIKR